MFKLLCCHAILRLEDFAGLQLLNFIYLPSSDCIADIKNINAQNESLRSLVAADSKLQQACCQCSQQVTTHGFCVSFELLL